MDIMSEFNKELAELRCISTELLEDNKFMCQQSIKKCGILLERVQNMNIGTWEDTTTKIKELLERMTTNIEVFGNQFATARDKFKRIVENNNRPKGKFNLSLRKKNGESEETDIDLTNSDEESSIPTKLAQKVSDVQVVQSSASEKGILLEEKKIKGSESDEISDEEVPINNFDVPIHNNSREGCVEATVMKETLEGFEKDVQQNQIKDDTEFESQSFDFDDDDDLNVELEKVEVGDEGVSESAQPSQTPSGTPSEAIREAHQNNHELLELLNQVTDTSNYAVYATTEKDGEEAMRLLEEEISNSTASDLDDSEDSELFSLFTSGGENTDTDSERELSDVTDTEDKSQEEIKQPSIRLSRVDEISDEEIDRLCNLHNLNKRKCRRTLRPHIKSKTKRQKLLSTSSSESTSTDSSSEGSNTPDFLLGDVERPVSSPPTGQDSINKLADILCDAMDTSPESSSSETDIEENKPKKKKKKQEEKSVDLDEEVKNKENKGEEENKDKEQGESNKEDGLGGKEKERRNSSWKSNHLLWTDSEDEQEKEEEEEEEEKPKPIIIIGSPRLVEEDPTIISDSMSDTDDDVTFVEEGDDEGGEAKGRKNIRRVMDDDELNFLTQQAKTEEDERIQRLEEHSKTMEMILSQHEEFVLDFDVKTKEPLIVVDENLVKKLKPHQKKGIQFMWEACYESVDMLQKPNSGTGCILAHCMGLGKTLQVITLIHTLFTHEVTNTKHVLIVCPLSTVSNWQNEFKMTFQLLSERPNIPLFFLIQQDALEKAVLVEKWREIGGVLVMGYETFQRLAGGKLKLKMSEEATQEKNRKLYEALIDPGPNLIVCDEGHLLKNGEAQRTRSLMKIKTKRRIVLTGTPLQNNLTEYYYMVDFVKTHLLGTSEEYNNRFANPIMNGQYDDSRPEDIKLMKKRTHVLTKLLKKTIHRVDAEVLQSYLPEIEDYAIFVKLEPLQIELYKRYIELAKAQNSSSTKSAGFFQDFRMTKLITLHPHTINIYQNDLKNKKRKRKTPKEVINLDGDVEEPPMALRISENWCDSLLPPDVSTNLKYSAKLRVIMAIINETVRNGEKILVFAHLLSELDLVEYFLKTFGTADYPHWALNENYYRIDGDVTPATRNELCNNFNLFPDISVFLISHGVGGLGLNLTAASRVILIGANHNPSKDTQSIYRVYRFGQTKKCYVYRVLAFGAMEEKSYHRCVAKLAVAGTVVDKYHFDRHYKITDNKFMYEYNFETQQERPIPSVPADKLLAKLLQSNTDIYKYLEHSALLENRPEEELNDEDKKLAWDEFTKEEKAEEAVKNQSVALQPLSIVPNRPLIQNSTLTQNRPSAQIRPQTHIRAQTQNRSLNRPSDSNGLAFYPLGANGHSMVANPMNTSARTLFNRISQNQAHVLKPTVPQANNVQNRFSMFRPQYNGYNRYVPGKTRLNPLHQNQSRPGIRLEKVGLTQNGNRSISNTAVVNLTDNGENQENDRHLNHSNQNSGRATIDARSVKLNPVTASTWYPRQEVINLVDEGPSFSGEFNYALNKVV